MLYIYLITAILIPVFLGLLLLSLIFQHKKIGALQRLVFAYGLGAGLVTLTMLGLCFLKLPFNGFNLGLPLVILTGICCFIIWRKNFVFLEKNSLFFRGLTSKRRTDLFSWLEIVLIVIILFEIVFVFSQTLLRPTIAFDALANWSFRAKVFFTEKQMPLDPGSPVFLGGGGHINYPLHISFFQTWIALWLGEFNDVFINIIFAFYFICLIGLIYSGLKSFCSRKHSLIFTVFACTLPFLIYHGFNAYADLPLAFYFTGAVICFYYFLTKHTNSWLYLSGFLIGVGAWTKFEGVLLSIVIFTALCLYILRHRISDWMLFFKPFLLCIFCFLLFFGPWALFKMWWGLDYTNIPGYTSFDKFHPEIFPHVFRALFQNNSFNIWPLYFILIVVLTGFAKTFKTSYIWLYLILFGAALGYGFIYFFTPAHASALGQTAFSRSVLHIIPVSIFLGGILAKNLRFICKR